MIPLVLSGFLTIGLVAGGIPYTQNVTGYIEDDNLFRIVCILNTATNPKFNIKVTGLAANGTLLFRVTFGGFSTYQMSLYVDSNQGSQNNNDYNVLVSESGVPKIPVLLAYYKGLFTVHSSGKGYYLPTVARAADLETVSVSGSGANLVDCMEIECFINGNFVRFIN